MIFKILLFVFIACKNPNNNSNNISVNEKIHNKNNQTICCENSLKKHLNEKKGYKIDDKILEDSLCCVQAESAMRMAYIPGGVFSMGSSHVEIALKRELPQHKVKI